MTKNIFDKNIRIINNLDINFERLIGHGHNPDEPNDVLGDETCVRMRGGMYNDALCGDSNGFNKNEMQVSKFVKNDPSLT